MLAEVERQNLELGETYAEIDSLLEATLDVDDYVDLDLLRGQVEHPAFDRPDLENPVPAPSPIPDPPKPILRAPPPSPTGLQRLFGKKRLAKAVAEAASRHERALIDWNTQLQQLNTERQATAKKHELAEAERLASLEIERARYQQECDVREAQVTGQNSAVDELIAGLSYGAVDAVQEYVSIVLSNSLYPEDFPVAYDFDFDPSSAELRLRVLVPPPDKIPDIKAYKYNKSADDIAHTSLSQKACRDRYADAVHQVALRSLHEVFEADRRGIIQTIDLEVGTKAIHPATGLNAFLLFVATASQREAFLELELSAVVPSATLAHLGSTVSKNPFGLVTIDSSGIRKS
jgi:restriction system protein